MRIAFLSMLGVALLLRLNLLHPLAWYSRAFHGLLLCALLLAPVLLAFALRNRTARFQRTLLVVFSVACVLLACEVAARIMPVVNTLAVNPGIKFFWPDSVYYPRNSHGFRQPEFGKMPGYRILCIGDSFTEGVGVERNETFSAVLGQSLDGVEVYNLGRAGANTVEEVAQARKLATLLDPDLIILAYVSNDAETHPVTYSTYRTPHKIKAVQRRILHKDGSYFAYRLFCTFSLFPTGLSGDDVRRAQFAADSPGWLACVKALEELANSPETRDINKLAIVFPFEPTAAYQQAIETIRAHGIETHGLAPLYKQHEGEDLVYSSADVHPNVQAHRLIGEWLAGKVKELTIGESQ